jgi:hypothetical protein
MAYAIVILLSKSSQGHLSDGRKSNRPKKSFFPILFVEKISRKKKPLAK